MADPILPCEGSGTLGASQPGRHGLRTHITSIHRYYKRVMRDYLDPNRKDPDHVIQQLAATSDFTATLDGAMVLELKRRAYYAAEDRSIRIPDLVRICKFVLPLRRPRL